jgi:hypothetical protein
LEHAKSFGELCFEGASRSVACGLSDDSVNYLESSK